MSRRQKEPEPASWGDFLRDYRRSQTAPPPILERPRPFLPKSELNPITGVYRDEQTELRQREVEQTMRTHQLQTGLKKAMRQDSKFDPLTGKPRFEGLVETEQPRPAIRPRRRINEQSTEEYVPWRKKPGDQLKEYVERREYDIISNHYLWDHDSKVQVEETKKRTMLAERYWKINRFDPITGTYNHPEEEKKARETEQKVMEARRKQREARIPERIRYSDGALVDVVTGMPKNEERLRMELQKQESSRKRASGVKYEHEKAVRARDEEQQKLAESRALRRISAQRFLPEVTRGYDIISLQAGQGSASPRRPMAIRESSWARLTGTLRDVKPSTAPPDAAKPTSESSASTASCS